MLENKHWVDYLVDSVKATVLGKIKDAACINIGEQLFQRGTVNLWGFASII